MVVAVLAGCGDGRPLKDLAEATPPANTQGTATPLVSTVTPAATPTATPSIEQEVLTSYEMYWRAYSAALLELDGALVDQVADGEEKERVRREIADLQAEGVALRVNVQRNPLVVESNQSSAIIFDEMVNNSFYVDAVTKQPPQGSGSGAVLRDIYYLEKIGNTWKVVRSVRQK